MAFVNEMALSSVSQRVGCRPLARSAHVRLTDPVSKVPGRALVHLRQTFVDVDQSPVYV